MHDIQKLKNIASQVRRDIVRMVHACQSGHPGGSLGCTDFLVALYFDAMKRKEGFDMTGKGEDVFYLSNGHISPVFYSVLAHAGYFDKSELATFRKLNSRLQGHPTTHEHLPGVRIASGSLGQGLSVAVGHAVGKKLDNDTNLVFSLHGDGELQEGQNWEAIMYASHNKVDNLIATVDYNGQQIDGPTSKVLSLGNLKTKFEAFDWKVLEVENGNDMEEILKVLDEAKSLTGKGQPICILLKTEMGYGVDYMMGTHAWHGKAPNDEQLEKALDQLEETLGDY
ncbi:MULTISPECIES: transketolase [unclassified Chryseobacterium]|uniref:transketolase n=1 Tax=unclassified Chryseobacterium TaxID=2593645 RepID=UPI000D382D82|nr:MULTISPECIES: transketolase [unclassified Chryseobacterium]PTT76922.1 transketolase [Chryseobacterium sp. HMWF001]PVV55992.1 transketolase [Chryseobacterium sp. HMWF035]